MYSKEKMERLHREEREYNLEIGFIDNEIMRLIIRKEKMKRLISKKRKYMNLIINEKPR